jgi:hypothetical protein
MPFSELLMLGLVLFTVFLNGVVYLTNKPADLQGLSYLAGAALMVGVYYWSRRKYQSLTDTLNSGILIFLLQYGFNWLLWDCFIASYYNHKSITIGFWIFGLIHFVSAVYMLSFRSNIMHKFPIGLLLFAGGFVVLSVASYYSTPDHVMLGAGWLYLLFALLQTGGLLMMSFADVDPNIYFREHNGQLILVIFVWVAARAFAALRPPLLALNQVSWLECLPWMYLLARFKAVTQAYPGFPLFTELFAAALVLTFVEVSALDFGSGGWNGLLLGCTNLLCAVLTLAVALYYSPRRLKYNATVQFQMIIATQLFFLGVMQMASSTLNMLYFGDTAEEDPSLTPQGWAFGPVHIVPAIIFFCFRKTIHRFFGNKWLELRLQRESSKDGIRQRIASDLGWLAAVETDITEGKDLNSYVEQVAEDEYTRLLLACWASKLDAVQRLLTYDVHKVDVNKPSMMRGWSPLFVAAHNGDLQLAKMLLEYGAAVEQRTNDGQSPLFIASARKHTDVCSLLIEHGANASGGDRWMGLSPQELLPISRKQQQQRGTGEGSEVVGRGWGGDSRGNNRDSSGLESTLDSTLDGSCIDSALESGARSTGTDSMSSRPSSRSTMVSRSTGASGTSSLAGDEGREGSFGSGRSSL